MIKIVKNSWNQITIADYKKISNIQSRELDSDMEKTIAILAILCDVSEDDLYSMNINDLQNLMMQMDWLSKPYTFNKNWNFKHIVIDGVKYDVEVDINKFTVAQYMDFQIYWDKRNDVNYMGKLLTTFIKPKGCKYNEGYDIEELASKLENTLNINDWNSICFFFLKSLMYSLKGFLLYSEYKLKKMKTPQAEEALKQMMQINSIL